MPDPLWRVGATEPELTTVAAIDKEVDRLNLKRATLARERYLITNRAGKREAYRRKTEEKGKK